MSASFTNLTDFSAEDLVLPPKERMSEEAFVAWAIQTRARAEWVNGEVVSMSPANRDHYELGLWLMRLLGDFVEAKELGIVGYDMLLRLGAHPRLRVPDVFFVAKGREHIIEPTMLREPPDLAIEIVSPDSSARDWREKYFEYQDFGIREYWVIDPIAGSFEIYRLGDGGKYQHVDVVDGIFHSTVIAGLWLKTEWLAPARRPTVREALRQLGVL